MKSFFFLAFFWLLLSPLSSVNQYPLDSDYHKWQTLGDSLLNHHLGNRLISDIEVIGNSSVDKLPLYAFHIHNSPKIKNKKKKLWEHKIPKDVKKVLIIGQHHGEEPIGVEIAMSLIRDLTSDKSYSDLLSAYYFVVIPTINPEAFKIVNSGQYPLKRKNNRDSNENGTFDLKTDGVDLNKNYPSNWELADLNDRESPYFKGESPASESETQAVMQVAERFNFDFAFFYHSSANGTYPEMIFFPYYWEDEKSQDWDQMKEIADALAADLPCFFKEDNYEVFTGHTSQYGYARDYFYKNFSTFAFTIEVSGITPNGVSLFLPNNTDLKKIVNKHKRALINLLRRNR